MDKKLFFHVWSIYQDHWGKDEQEFFKRKESANLLNQTFHQSKKMRALLFMHHLLTIVWDMNMFLYENEVLDAVRDMSDVCLGEEYTQGDEEMDPYLRLTHGVHCIKPTCYLTVEEREWKNIQKPSVFITDVDIYSISALLLLP